MNLLENGLHEVLDSGHMEPETLREFERMLLLMDLEADMQEPDRGGKRGDGPCSNVSSPTFPR